MELFEIELRVSVSFIPLALANLCLSVGLVEEIGLVARFSLFLQQLMAFKW
jgi:hypothetical protein